MSGSAPYRFVELSNRVVEPPISFSDLNLSLPLKDGSYSGIITITWISTTPTAVGEKAKSRKDYEAWANGAHFRRSQVNGENKEGEIEVTSYVKPVKIGGRYCLPGPSLKGMIRSVLEIITYSHLSRINSWRHVSIRTYKSDDMPKPYKHNAKDIRAGWLTYNQQQDCWYLKPAGTDGVGYSSITLNELKNWTDIKPDKWQKKSIKEKYDILQNKHLQIKGYIVATGQAAGGGNNPKDYEFKFAPPSNNEYPIDADTMELFHRLHADPAPQAWNSNPVRNWRFWLIQFGYNPKKFVFKHDREDDCERVLNPPPLPGIPVFYIGDPNTNSEANQTGNSPNFFFGLSPILRLPRKYSVGDVAQRRYQERKHIEPYKIPRLGETPHGWDFARAIFGDVEGAAELEELSNAKALAGRVAVGFAFAEQQDPERSDSASHSPIDENEVTGVFGRPRESYEPFYLRRVDDEAAGAIYDYDNAIPAGRKRYIVRENVVYPSLENNEQGGERKDESIKNVGSTVAFLKEGTRFQGEIRFHNLHKVELGALLWTLTFGDPNNETRPYRHQIGRGKANGFGALHAEINLDQLMRHGKAIDEKSGNQEQDGNEQDHTHTVGCFLGCFEKYMLEKLELDPSKKNFWDLKEIKQLRLYAHKKTAVATEHNQNSLTEKNIQQLSELRKGFNGKKNYGLPNLDRPK